MKLALPQSDLKLLEHTSDETLLSGERGTKNMADIASGVLTLATVMQDVTHRGKYTGAAGFTEGGFFQHVASIPQAVIAAIVLIDPEIMIKRSKFYAYLAGPGRVWDVRRKTIKGAM